MLVAALIFGLLGGLVGLAIGVLVFLGDLLEFAFGEGGTQIRGVLVLVFAVMALVGAFASLKRPWFGALSLFIAGLGCMITINVFGAPVFFLTLLGSFSAIRGRRERR